MSNAMSRSKSRWKGALLATVATAAITPLAAKAQSLTIGIFADPLGGGASPNVYSKTGNGTPLTNAYIDPYDTDTLYVYGQVTGTKAPSATYVDGLQFAYFNVNASASLASFGSVTPTLVAQFNGGNQNGSAGNAGAGAQTGTIGAIGTTASIVQGGPTFLTTFAKARSNNDVYNAGVSNGSNTVISGNSVYFLLETLTYTPNSATVVANPSAPGTPESVAFNVSIPSVPTSYVQGNYFVGLPSTPVLSPGPSNTFTGVTSSAGNVKLTQALPGDVNLDGSVNINDFNIIAGVFNTSVSGWTNGDLTNDGQVNINDFNVLAANFNTTLGSGPSGLAGATALVAPGSSVPEPTAGLLLAGGAIAGLRRRRRAK